MMKIHNVEQGSKEWHDLRLKYFTASEAAVMMGDCKYMSRNELLELKKTGISKPVNEYTQKIFDKGHAVERLAREMQEIDYLTDLPPVTGSIEIEGLDLLASFDGLPKSMKFVWECKQWNAWLPENVKKKILGPEHYWQLEHQLLVSGVGSATFTVTDGTEQKRVSMVYISLPERRRALIDGWHQFKKDLENHEVKPLEETVKPANFEYLPALVASVGCGQITTNIKDFIEVARERSTIEINRVMETDLDYANKKELAKCVKKSRAEIKEIALSIRAQFSEYCSFMDSAEELDKILQPLQAHSEKQVKTEEDNKKRQLINDAHDSIYTQINKLDIELGSPFLQRRYANFNFAPPIKNKRTTASVQDAVDTYKAQILIDINREFKEVSNSLAIIKPYADDNPFLFKDLDNLAWKDEESLKSVIDCRISEFKNELIRKEQLEIERRVQERVRQDEEEFKKNCAANNEKEIQELEAIAPGKPAPIIEVKSAPADLDLSLTVECPHCDYHIDLLENDDENFYVKSIINNKWHNIDDKDEMCPECSGEFKIEGVNY